VTAYYNEIDPNAAEWLRQLIKMGQIASGDVDERSIEDVTPDELAAYTQCHFFAGIGAWSYALRQAGWADDRPIWTGSCPCQPFSAAGKGAGIDDERHLWPALFWLISQCRPETVIGEQVASSDGLGWWDIVSADLEGAGYACGANDLCAAGVGAPHIRQRLYWVADTSSQRRQQDPRGPLSHEAAYGGTGRHRSEPDADHQPSGDGQNGRGLGNASEQRLQIGRQPWKPAMGSEVSAGMEFQPERRSAVDRPWANAEWIYCRDGKARPVEPGLFPLVNGPAARVGCSGDISLQAAKSTAEGRVMRLKGYGNAIAAPLAVEFIGACMEVLP